jgi:hypothetical protein
MSWGIKVFKNESLLLLLLAFLELDAQIKQLMRRSRKVNKKDMIKGMK